MKTKSTYILFVIFLLFAVNANAQKKYKRTYMMKENHFKHVASLSSGDAIIYIDRDSLIDNFIRLTKYQTYDDPVKEKIKSTGEKIKLLSQKSDTTTISSANVDKEVTNVMLSYFLDCALSKKANVLDKRTDKFVKKIIAKKPPHSSKSQHIYSGYYYYLPNDKVEFMNKIERIGSGVKFL